MKRAAKATHTLQLGGSKKTAVVTKTRKPIRAYGIATRSRRRTVSRRWLDHPPYRLLSFLSIIRGDMLPDARGKSTSLTQPIRELAV